MEVLIHLCLIYLTTICNHSNTIHFMVTPTSFMQKEVKVDLWLFICTEIMLEKPEDIQTMSDIWFDEHWCKH